MVMLRTLRQAIHSDAMIASLSHHPYPESWSQMLTLGLIIIIQDFSSQIIGLTLMSDLSPLSFCHAREARKFSCTRFLSGSSKYILHHAQSWNLYFISLNDS